MSLHIDKIIPFNRHINSFQVPAIGYAKIVPSNVWQLKDLRYYLLLRKVMKNAKCPLKGVFFLRRQQITNFDIS